MQPMKLRADLSNMHLIDDSTGKCFKSHSSPSKRL